MNFLLKVLSVRGCGPIWIFSDWVLHINDTGLTKSLWAHTQDNFWCTLDVDGNLAWSIWVLNCNSGVFQSSAKWNCGSYSSLLPLNQDVDRDVGILEEAEKTNLCTIASWSESGLTHLHGGRAIIEDAVLNKLDGLLGELTMEESVFSGVLELVGLKIKVSHSHLVGR